MPGFGSLPWGVRRSFRVKEAGRRPVTKTAGRVRFGIIDVSRVSYTLMLVVKRNPYWGLENQNEGEHQQEIWIFVAILGADASLCAGAL